MTMTVCLSLSVLSFFFNQNLKSHAVTMFEVGKLSDETLDSFLAELEKVRAPRWEQTEETHQRIMMQKIIYVRVIAPSLVFCRLCRWRARQKARLSVTSTTL